MLKIINLARFELHLPNLTVSSLSFAGVPALARSLYEQTLNVVSCGDDHASSHLLETALPWKRNSRKFAKIIPLRCNYGEYIEEAASDSTILVGDRI